MLAQEVMEHLQKTAGHTPYMAVYNRVHARVQQVREERREGKKIRVPTFLMSKILSNFH